MNTLKIASWNVNSLKVRLPHLLQWLDTNQPDVIALQETKISDDQFPFADLQQAGYRAVVSGQKAYNGVAILSREPMEDIIVDLPGEKDPQRRVLGAMVGNVRIFNLYVPNGEHPLSAKFNYKMSWLEKLNAMLSQQLQQHEKIVVLGDFNIAPAEMDVYDPQYWAGKILFTPDERKAFSKLIELGFADCYRLVYPQVKKYTWWDYRMNAFQRNIGMRIDHILASDRLKNQCAHCHIDPIPRGWERPSDHTPIVAEFHI